MNLYFKRVYSYQMKPMKYIFVSVLLALVGIMPAVGQTNTGGGQQPPQEEKNKIQSQSTNMNENLANPVILEPSRSAQSPGFYRGQTETLRRAVDFNKYDAKSWLGYYKAERYSYYTKTSNDINTDQQSELDKIVDEMSQYVPTSYEFNYAKYLNGNHDIRLFGFLAKAYEINPKATELFDQFVSYYELTGDAVRKTDWCKKLNESGEIPKEIMEFAYNLLVSLDENAVIITHGEMDSHSSFIWQTVKNHRKDVLILYMDLLEKPEYREKKFRELGINVTASPYTNKAAFVAEFLQKSSLKRPSYLATTVAPDLIRPIQSKLFLTGLAFKYSEKGFDNLPVIAENWEKKFRKEELAKKIAQGSVSAKINMNYVPGLLLLRDYLLSKGLNDKAKATEELALKIGSEGGKEQQVRTMIMKK